MKKGDAMPTPTPATIGAVGSPITHALHDSFPMVGMQGLAEAYNKMRHHAEDTERKLHCARMALERIAKEQLHSRGCATQTYFFTEAKRAEQAAKGCTCWLRDVQQTLTDTAP